MLHTPSLPCHSWHSPSRCVCTWASPWRPPARPAQCPPSTGTWACSWPAPPAAGGPAALLGRPASWGWGGWHCRGCPSLGEWVNEGVGGQEWDGGWGGEGHVGVVVGSVSEGRGGTVAVVSCDITRGFSRAEVGKLGCSIATLDKSSVISAYFENVFECVGKIVLQYNLNHCHSSNCVIYNH